jgi:hydrogenase-4 component B
VKNALAAAGGGLASAVLIAAGVMGMLGMLPVAALPFSFPLLGAPHFGLGPFSGFFAIVAGLVALPVSIYSSAYLTRYTQRYSIGWFTAWYLVLLLSILGIFAAVDVVAFFVSWEVMTLASCALVAFEWREFSKVRTSLLMLAMSEIGTLAALLAFLLAASPSHSLDFGAIARTAATLSPGTRIWIVLLSFFGFSVKAGVLPFNAWLPHAHPEAPANVSALLSGVILTLGIYGMLLVNLAIVPQSALLFGAIALATGALSAIAGILYATIDNDLKRVLGFSSVENLGIVVAALGAGAIFFGYGRLDLAALGIGAGLWHMTNHALYKGLLFLGAGAVDTQTGTRNINLLGGIARAMPVTTGCFFIGALAIAAIPPLNGFPSEWLTLETLLRSAELAPVAVRVGFVLAGALLALTAALAVTCFVKAFAMTFLGIARSEAARNVRAELSAAAGIGMGILAGCCLVAGIFPAYVAQLVDAALPGTLRGQLASALLPPFLSTNGGGLSQSFLSDFQAIGARIGAGIFPGRSLVLLHRGGTANPVVFAMSSTYLAVFIILMLLGIFIAVRVVSHRRRVRTRIWAGGQRPLLPEMTYTATGFSNPVRVIFDAVFNPRTIENTRETVAQHFRVAITRRREDVFIADRFATNPIAVATRWVANLVARIHHGRLEGYVLYALAALLVAIFAIAY